MTLLSLDHEAEMALAVLITAVKRRVTLGAQLAAGAAEENETYAGFRNAFRHELEMSAMFCDALARSARTSNSPYGSAVVQEA